MKPFDWDQFAILAGVIILYTLFIQRLTDAAADRAYVLALDHVLFELKVNRTKLFEPLNRSPEQVVERLKRNALRSPKEVRADRRRFKELIKK